MCSSDLQRITLVTSSHRIALARSRREFTLRRRCRRALQRAIRISCVENNLNSACERLPIGVRHRYASARILKHQRPAQCTPPTWNQSAQQRARHLTTHQQAHRAAQFLRRAKRATRGCREQRYGRMHHRMRRSSMDEAPMLACQRLSRTIDAHPALSTHRHHDTMRTLTVTGLSKTHHGYSLAHARRARI